MRRRHRARSRPRPWHGAAGAAALGPGLVLALGVGLFPALSGNLRIVNFPTDAEIGAARAVAPPTRVTFTQAQLDRDLGILKEALTTLHPGLYRYNSPAEIAEAFETLHAEWRGGIDRREAYLALARFLAKIRCGHTYTNFWNQPDEVKAELFEGTDKVPFTFRFLGTRMVVTGDATGAGALPRGTEVLSIDGLPVSELLAELMAYANADGSNDAKRVDQMEVRGVGDFESFDVYAPLLHPPAEGSYALTVRTPGSAGPADVRVATVSRAERAARLLSAGGDGDDGAGRGDGARAGDGATGTSDDDLWSFEIREGVAPDGVGILRIGTFVTWSMELDWRAFLADAFGELEARAVPDLILDVRGNEGGDNAVLDLLLRWIVSEDIEVETTGMRTTYRSVPDALRPYIDTWDPGFLDRGDTVVEDGAGGFVPADPGPAVRTIRAREDAFPGRVWLLIDPANSSATFSLANTLETHGLATLVGRETGGSRRGINGGQILFLHLPETKLEADIPAIAYHLPGDPPDEGVRPDIEVVPTVEDVVAGRDAVLERALEAIRARR